MLVPLLPGCSAAPAPSEPAPVAVTIEPAPRAVEISEPEEGGYELHPGVAVPEAWVDCDSEEDCAIIEAGCCNHCNGGTVLAVNRAFAERARARLAHVGCDAACGSAACHPAGEHRIVCMTRACHLEDVEDELHRRIWGGQPDDETDPGVRIDSIEAR